MFFQNWGEVSPLTFEQVSSRDEADIDILFGVDNHSYLDPETRDFDHPFDGPGGALGHCYFPFSGGNLHFDDDEDWRIDSDEDCDYKTGQNIDRIPVKSIC